jgi:hypothetical protein
MNNNNIDIKVTAKDMASDALKSVKGSIDGLVSLATIAAIGAVAQQLLELGRKANDLNDVMTGFSRNFGNSVENLNRLRDATGGAISDMNLLQNANKASLTGVSDNIDEIARLMQIAQVRGKELGRSTQETFDSMSQAVLRPRMLKSLGFDIPESLANISDGMTTAEQKTLGLNIVLSQGSQMLKDYADSGVSVADEFEQFQATIDNLVGVLGQMFLPIITVVLAVITKVAEGIQSLFTDGKPAAQEMTKAVKGTSDGLKALSKEAITARENIAKIRDQIQQENEAYNKQLASIIDGRKNQVAENKKLLEKEQKDFFKSQEKNLKEFNKTQDQLKKEYSQKTKEQEAQNQARLRNLENSLREGLVAGSSTYEQQTQMMVEALNAEKLAGDQKVTDIKTQLDEELKSNTDKFEEEKANAQEAYDETTNALKSKIAEDEALLNKHAEDAKTINRSILLDEIDELEKEQSAWKGATSNIKNDYASKIGEMNNLKLDVSKLFDSVDWNRALKSILAGFARMAFNIVKLLMNVGIDVIMSISQEVAKAIGQITGDPKFAAAAKLLGQWQTSMKADTARRVDSNRDFFLDSVGLKGYATGTNYAMGGSYLVGEKGPEVVTLPAGSSVTPNDQMSSKTGNNIVINNYNSEIDYMALSRNIGFILRTL